ncbi:ABC transporter permease [Marinibaculum pumilum]|uniref:ABC transporter permease n=1 Tax=Marinibaculum pumilum TaxID=1766165 RepID=A0ABV7L9P2_9PROT
MEAAAADAGWLAVLGAWLAATLRSATPLLFALSGETLVQRTAVINLGTEGQLLAGACGGFAVAAWTGDPLAAIAAGALAGMLLSAIHAGLCLGLGANQIGSGIAVWMLGLGLTSYFGRDLVGAQVAGFGPLLPDAATGFAPLDLLLRQLGPATLAALLLPLALGLWLRRAHAGLRWQAVGESFDAARALGIRPGMVQLQAVLLGGLLSGIGGAILSVDYTQTWANDISKGLGLVAVGLVIAARWNPWLVLPVALLFGGTDAAVLRLQAAGVEISSYLLACLPYLLCLGVVVLGYLRQSASGGMPAELRRVFR